MEEFLTFGELSSRLDSIARFTKPGVLTIVRFFFAKIGVKTPIRRDFRQAGLLSIIRKRSSLNFAGMLVVAAEVLAATE